MLNDYEKQLRQTNLADNTIVSYCHSLKQYLKMYENVFTKKNLLSFKGFLIENYSPKTVNLRILAINKYLEFNKLDKLKLKMIKVPVIFCFPISNEIPYEKQRLILYLLFASYCLTDLGFPTTTNLLDLFLVGQHRLRLYPRLFVLMLHIMYNRSIRFYLSKYAHGCLPKNFHLLVEL